MDRIATTRIGRWDSTRPLNFVPPVWWRSIEQETTLEDVFNGFPHGDYRPKFAGQLDRDIYEHTPAGASEPMGAHEIADTCPRHLDPSVLAKRARCTHHEAIQLADALAVLDADTKLSNEICRWAFTRGVEATLKYLHPYLVAVAEVESEETDQYDDLTVKQLSAFCKSVDSKAAGRTRVHWVAAVQRFEESLIEDSPEETLGYHTLTESQECDWIENQPQWFQSLIASVQKAATIESLKGIGKAVFTSGLNGNRASVFWSFYKIRKEQFARKLIIKETVAIMADLIKATTKEHLGELGKKLFALQRDGGPKLNSKELTFIWGTYHERKEQLALAA